MKSNREGVCMSSQSLRSISVVATGCLLVGSLFVDVPTAVFFLAAFMLALCFDKASIILDAIKAFKSKNKG